MDINDTAVFDKLESNVRSYCRGNSAVFERAEGATLFDENGGAYLDFLAGAGSLNYGHNHPALRDQLVQYITDGGVTHSLDFHTAAKRDFLETFQETILQPRQMNYVAQFTGPTGANAVEAALKLARKVTGRASVVAFTNGFHGVTLGALAVTGNQHHRGGAGVPLDNVQRMPFAGYLDADMDTLAYFEKALSDKSSGVDLPACVIVETVQGEGGLNVASGTWMRRLQKICRAHSILLVVDDIQAGCGRTGTFFSFEGMGVEPDMVTLSKSLSGYGLPLAVTLIRPELDCWLPGEHNGTFRGFNHAFVTAKTALDVFWKDEQFQTEIQEKSKFVQEFITRMCRDLSPLKLSAKGRGLMQGLSFDRPELASATAELARERNLVIETAGPNDEVLKFFPPLTITFDELTAGLEIVEDSLREVLDKKIISPIAAE